MPRGLPGLGVLPAGVGRVVQVQQQPLATVQKSEPEDIVPHECELRNEENIADKRRPGAADLAGGDQQLAAQRAVPVHVLDVGFQRRIGVVDQVVVQRGGLAVERDRLVDRPILELRRRRKVRRGAAEQPQLGVWIEAAMLDPAPQKKIAALDVIGIGGRVGGQQLLDLLLQLAGSTPRRRPATGSRCTVHLAIAEFLEPEKPCQSSSKTLALYARAISTVRSVEDESSTMISSANCTLASVRARFASSFLVMMATESVCGTDIGVKVLSCLLAPGAAPQEVRATYGDQRRCSDSGPGTVQRYGCLRTFDEDRRDDKSQGSR